MSKFVPRERPSDLPEVTEFPPDPVITVPTDPDDRPTFEWCEALRDHYEKEGQLLTIKGLHKIADTTGLDDGDIKTLKRQMDSFYGKKTNPKSAKPEPKKEKPVAPTKTTKPVTKPSAPKKAAGKPDKSSPKGKPAKTAPAKAKGKAENKANPKGKKPTAKVHKADAKVVYEGKVKGVPVKVTQAIDSTRIRVTLFDGIALRAAMRWFGKNKWETADVVDVSEKLLAGWKNGKGYVAECIEEGQVGSGRKAVDGKSPLGPIPNLTKEQKNLLTSL